MPVLFLAVQEGGETSLPKHSSSSPLQRLCRPGWVRILPFLGTSALQNTPYPGVNIDKTNSINCVCPGPEGSMEERVWQWSAVCPLGSSMVLSKELDPVSQSTQSEL